MKLDCMESCSPSIKDLRHYYFMFFPSCICLRLLAVGVQEATWVGRRKVFLSFGALISHSAFVSSRTRIVYHPACKIREKRGKEGGNFTSGGSPCSVPQPLLLSLVEGRVNSVIGGHNPKP